MLTDNTQLVEVRENLLHRRRTGAFVRVACGASFSFIRRRRRQLVQQAGHHVGHFVVVVLDPVLQDGDDKVVGGFGGAHQDVFEQVDSGSFLLEEQHHARERFSVLEEVEVWQDGHQVVYGDVVSFDQVPKAALLKGLPLERLTKNVDKRIIVKYHKFVLEQVI